MERLCAFVTSTDDPIYGTYRKDCSEFISKYVLEYIVKKNALEILEQLLNWRCQLYQVCCQPGMSPSLFVSYSLTFLFIDEKTMENSFIVTNMGATRPSPLENIIELVHCKEKKKVERVVASARKNEKVLFTPYAKSNLLFSFCALGGQYV